MSTGADIGARARSAARTASTLLAVDPHGIGGVVVRAHCGPVRESWVSETLALLPAGTPVSRIASHITDERLLGGLDFAATLARGQPVHQRGALAAADGGLLVLASAERFSAGQAARIAAASDRACLVLERDGLAAQHSTRFGVIALDEGDNEDERAPAAIYDRLALHIDLDGLAATEPLELGGRQQLDAVARARHRLADVGHSVGLIESLCAAASELGIESIRAPLLALRVARCIAALAGHATVTDQDAQEAVALVFAPRAMRWPSAEPPPAPAQDTPPEAHDPAPTPEAPQNEGSDATPPAELAAMMIAAAVAALPPDLLERHANGRSARGSLGSGRAAKHSPSKRRGRPIGVQPGRPSGGSRLDIVATLRAAAPWQRLRHQSEGGGRILIRSDDLRIKRLITRSVRTTIFVVDASGSAALNRLAEAKGAVELLLDDCYVSRDQVALIAFRGRAAEIVLPPTRALARVKRVLAGFPAGGGTPLASGIDAAVQLIREQQRRGSQAVMVLMTDGRANVARDGRSGRVGAESDSVAAARGLRATGATALLIDTAPRPEPKAALLADAMGAHYVPLPYADASAISRTVRAVTEAATGPARRQT